MKLRRSLAVPLVTALAAGLSVPALTTTAFADDGAPAGSTVAIRQLESSGGDDDAAFTAAWNAKDPVAFWGESRGAGAVDFANDGGLDLTVSSTTDQAFVLVPANVKLGAATVEPSLVASSPALGLQLRGDADGDGSYDAADYFTLVQYGPDDWRLSNASGSAAKDADPGVDHHAFSDWVTALGAASVQDVGVSLGSGAPAASATLTALSFAGVTYTFPGPQDFSAKAVKVSGTVKVGSKLTADVSGWIPAPQAKYQWNLDGKTIAGATAASYTPKPTDKDHNLSVTVGGSLLGYHDATVTTTPVKVAAGTLTAPTPTISGTAKVASTLTAHAGSWTTGTKLAYQWKRNGATISGATKNTYTLGAADRGTKLSVAVTGSLSGYTTATKPSAATATVGYAAFARTATPAISGTVRVGSKVTAKPGTWSPSATFSYRWKQNGHSISGATHSTYTPSSSYRGKRLTVTVTAKRSGYTTVTRTSASKTIGYGVLSAPTPKIAGTHRTGRTLKVSVGSWKPKPSYHYQWKRNGKSIKGATHTTYRTTSADRGKKVTVTVTGKKSGYTTRSRTSASAYITGPFAHTYAPTITGTTRVYSTLSAHVRTWSPKPKTSYQWRRDGKSIMGATHSSYKLAAADHGHKITVTATGKRGTYTTTSRTSAKTAGIAWPKGVSTPRITSQPRSLIEVSGRSASFSVKATGGSLRYQWQYSTDGKKWTTYSGKTSSKLTLTARTSLNARYYRVTAKNVAGTATSHSTRLFVLSTPLDPFSHYAPVSLWNWGAGFLDKTEYLPYDSTHTLVVSDALACYSGGGSATPWLDLEFDYLGSNGTVYDQDDAFIDGDIWDAGDVYSGGCTDPFYTVAVVPNSAVAGGEWTITDTSDWDNVVTQYVRP